MVVVGRGGVTGRSWSVYFLRGRRPVRPVQGQRRRFQSVRRPGVGRVGRESGERPAPPSGGLNLGGGGTEHLLDSGDCLLQRACATLEAGLGL